MSAITKEEAKTGACAYLLHMLVQRVEATQPGIVESLLHGARADQASCKEPSIEPIFLEAIAMLELIQAQKGRRFGR